MDGEDGLPIACTLQPGSYRTSPDSSGDATVTGGQVDTLGPLAHRGDG
jgi:hypothetical protein